MQIEIAHSWTARLWTGRLWIAGILPALWTARILRAFILLTTLTLLTPAAFAAQPNIILITIDTLRGDHLSYNGSGNVQTPNLDALAAQGANFERVRSAVPLTLPSHASIFTGLYPPSHGVRDNATFKLNEKMVTLAEVLKKRGYRTAAFVGSFVLDHRFGLDQGFDFYEDRTWTDATMLENFEAERTAGAVHQAAIDWVQMNAGKRQPLFLWIHFYDPHAPYTPPEPFRNRYAANPYAGEVAYTDSVIGQLRKDLESMKVWQNSVIAVVGDHGEGLGEHQETTHSVLIYNSTLHVPMFITAPGKIKAGTRIKQLCRTIDLAPTLLDYLGIQKEFGEGVSLRNLIEGKGQSELTAYSESLYPKLNLGWSELIGLESTNHHYIESPNPELFEIQKDPQEKSNRIQQFPKVALRHRNNLQKFAPAKAESSDKLEALDAETREKLASLGYVSGSPVKTPITEAIDPKKKIHIWNEIQKALYHRGRNEHTAAIQILKRLLKTEQGIPIVYSSLGNSYIQIEDWKGAEQIYDQALKEGLDSSLFRTNLGQIYHQKKDYVRAQQELEKAVSMDPSNVTAHYQLGNVFRARGELQKAIRSYDAALKINPAFVFALNGAGMAYAALNQNDRALQSFQQAVKIDPANAAAYFNLAVQLERMKQTKAALEAYKKFLQISNQKEFSAQRKRASEAIQRLQ